MKRTACKRVLMLVLAYAAFESLSAIFAIEANAQIVGALSIVGLAWACSSLFAKRRVTECMTIERGIVCISRYVDGELVSRRRVKAVRVFRRVDDAGVCQRVEIAGAARQFEIARDVLPAERERIVERLAAALREASVEAPVQTIRGAPTRGAQEIVPPSPAFLRGVLPKFRVRRCASIEASTSIPPEASSYEMRLGAFDAPLGARAKDVAVKRLKTTWIVCAAVSAVMVIPMLQAAPRPRDAIAAPRKAAPAFRLTSSTGEAVDDRSMLGRPFALFFGFTRCPEACPTTLLELTSVVKEAGADASDFEILFVSLDVEHDTPELLSDFVGSFGQRVVGLTGSVDDIARAARAFRVYQRKVPLEGGGYTIDHTTLVYLVDRRGRLVDTLSFTEQADIAAKRLKAFLLEEATHGVGRSGRRRSRIRGRRGAAATPARRSRKTHARQPAALRATSGRWTLYRCYSASRSDTRGERS
ncbi:hypothetical protein MJC1_00379 [Methylocystis sp. MJC1]|nr:hypothetical protein MJC1_00379 [Methylocystis sp. MJC1]